MKAEFTGVSIKKRGIQGRIRVIDGDGLVTSIKPHQIRNLSDTNNKWFARPDWLKNNRENCSFIMLHNSAAQSWHAYNRIPVNTSLDILEQIFDYAEIGASFDLTSYSGEDAKRLDDIQDVLVKRAVKKSHATLRKK